MNRIVRNILYFVMLCISISCAYEDIPEDETNSRGNVYVSFAVKSPNFTEELQLGEDGGIKDLHVWLAQFDETTNSLTTSKANYYKYIPNPKFENVKEHGVYTFDVVLKETQLPSYGKYKLFAVINGGSVESVNLDQNTVLNDFDTFDVKKNIGSTGIAMYGNNIVQIVKDKTQANPNILEVINMERSLSKLELYIGRSPSVNSFTIDKITLNNSPDKGLLVGGKMPKNVTYKSINLYTKPTGSTAQQLDGSVITKEDFETGNYSEIALFDKLKTPYLFENLNGPLHTDGLDHSGEVTESAPASDAAPEIKNGYNLVISYTLNGKSAEKKMYFYPLKRNCISRIYCFVDQKELNIDVQAILEWEEGPNLTPNYE